MSDKPSQNSNSGKRRSKHKKVYRRLDPSDRLLRAAAKYLAWRGGQAVIGGPIGITQVPNSGGRILPEFFLMIKIMGKLPTKPEGR